MSLAVQKVLVADGISTECSARLRKAGLQVTETGKLATDQLIPLLQDHDALLVRSATKVTSQVFGECPKLKLVGRAGTGTDNIDSDAATRRGVLVMNTPGGNTLSAAEHTCVLIAALSRQLPAACASLKAGQWRRGEFLGSELNGKTLAVLGLGRIGRQVAHRMLAFGMKVIGYDPVVSAEAAQEFLVEKRELDDIWADADYITVHTPLLPQTKHLINSDTLSRCKRGVRIVNVARGGIVDEEALLAALEAGQCGGAGLDVFSEEPPTDLRLVQHPGVICTPHLGGNTREAQLRVATELADQIVSAIKGGPLVGLVSGAGLADALSPTNEPWVALGKALGTLLSPVLQLQPDMSCQLEIVTSGQGMGEMQSCLRSGLLLGVLSGGSGGGHGGVNLVNAALLASEAGVTVSSLCWRDRDSVSGTVTARITAAEGGLTGSVTGALKGDQTTLLELNGARFEPGVTLGGHMLFFQGDRHPQTMVELVTALAAVEAHPVTVLTSASDTGAPILVVRLLQPQQSQQLQQQLQHSKLLLKADF